MRFFSLIILISLLAACAATDIPTQPKEINSRILKEMIGTSQEHVISSLGKPSYQVNIQDKKYVLYHGYGDIWGLLVVIYPVPIPPFGELKDSELYCYLLQFNEKGIFENYESRHFGANCQWGCEDLDWQPFTSQIAIETQLLPNEKVGTLEIKGIPKVKIKRLDNDEPEFFNYYMKMKRKTLLKLPPGHYLVSFTPWCNLEDSGKFEFSCKAGHSYIFDYKDKGRGPGRVSAWIYDSTEDEFVTEVWTSK